jgi:hypothetical protein|tara:strand:- start:2949 stop:3131 length:183 start_codon:yes stop_codon:yes gene_type:complete
VIAIISLQQNPEEDLYRRASPLVKNLLLLHLAYSEEDLKFKAEIPPFPEPPIHKSQCTPV